MHFFKVFHYTLTIIVLEINLKLQRDFGGIQHIVVAALVEQDFNFGLQKQGRKDVRFEQQNES